MAHIIKQFYNSAYNDFPAKVMEIGSYDSSPFESGYIVLQTERDITPDQISSVISRLIQANNVLHPTKKNIEFEHGSLDKDQGILTVKFESTTPGLSKSGSNLNAVAAIVHTAGLGPQGTFWTEIGKKETIRSFARS